MPSEIDVAADDSARTVKICGAPRTGKTEVLVRRCAKLMSSGVSPEQVWVVVSTGFAADEFQRRLVNAVQNEDALRVRISTVADICREVLSEEAAVRATGMNPRVLTSGERKFLLEDMKTTGVQNRTLRSLLRMFAREWAALEPEQAWLSPGEPVDIMNLLMSKLHHMRAMLPEELAFRCANYLKSDEGAHARHRFSYVLADDYQNLSRAEQSVVCSCAGVQLVVAGNPNQTVAVETDYPYPEGFVSFDSLRHDVSVHTLEKAFGNGKALAATAALTRHGDMDCTIAADNPQGAQDRGDARMALAHIKWNTPADELNGMTKYLRDLMDDEELLSGTYIIAPNRRWLNAAVDVCRQRDFKVDVAGASNGIGGDPRELGRARAMVAYVKLALLAEPDSAVAWRCWCGFGNHLLNSDAWMHLEEYADEHEISVVEALSRVSDAVARGEEPFLRCKVLAQAWQEGRSIIERDSKRKGFALLHAIGAEKLAEFADIARFVAGDESASELFELVYREVTNPHFSADEHCLRFITLGRMCGLTAENIIVLGCVDGFVPPRDAFEIVSTDDVRSELMNTSRREFASAIAKAEKRVLLSYFAKADLELAEKTKMKVTRVRSEDGARIALVHPSCFIEEFEEADPGATGGQQFLAERGL